MRLKVLNAASLLRRAGLLAALGLAAAVTVADIRRVASTFVVDSTADVDDANLGDGICETAPGNGVCTLRAAIQEANFVSGATVTFDPSLPSPTTFVLTLGSLLAYNNMTITGPGSAAAIIDASGDVTPDSVLLFTGSGPATLTISGLTLENGNAANYGGGIDLNQGANTLHLFDVTLRNNQSQFEGGGIFVNGTATLDHCTITGNQAPYGAGISSSGTLTVTASTIAGNSAADAGGGVYVQSHFGSTTLRDSTLTGNYSAYYGGGIANDDGPLNLINTTVTANFSDDDGGGIHLVGAYQGSPLHAYNSTITSNQAGVLKRGGGIFAGNQPATVQNTILAGNYEKSKLHGGVPDDCDAITSLDYNLVETAWNCTITGAVSHDVYGADPVLGLLQDNGGPTQTQALLEGSPAIDVANPTGCTDNLGATLTADQRGFVRPAGGRCDMGAYEFDSPGPPTPTPTRTRTPTRTSTPTRTPTGVPSSVAPEALVVNPDGDGIFEPGQSMAVDPVWGNTGVSSVSLTSTAQSFSGPPGASYAIVDDSAAYGSIPPVKIASCSVTANCFQLSAAALGSRPATHWDATFTETPSSGDPAKIWTLHIGGSFSDVPTSQPFYKKIETLLHSGITTGCTGDDLLPRRDRRRAPRWPSSSPRASPEAEATSRRAARVGASPYNCTAGGVSLFSDVSPTDIFCKHVHYIASKHVTSGCSAGKYCPGDDVSRLEMASFIAKAVVEPNGGPAIPMTYGPDPVTGLSYSCNTGSPNVHFTDVPATRLLLQARSLPLGEGHHRRLHLDHLLPDGHRFARSDGQVPRQRFRIVAVWAVAAPCVLRRSPC